MSIHHWINNQNESSPSTYTVTSPSNQEAIHQVFAADDHVLDNAVSAASTAFVTWKNSSIKTRRTIFTEVARLLQQRADEYSTLMSKETPMAPQFSGLLVKLSLDQLIETSACLSALGKAEIVETDDGEAHTTREPFGVCLAMAPWNAPLNLAFRATVTPIMAGNTVVMMSSELSPASHAILGPLFKDAGLPDGVLNIIHVDPKDRPSFTEKLISHKKIRHINFTGSTKVGRIIATLAAKVLKPAVLELGGKAPAVILEDANLDIAVSNVIFGALAHQGQVCMSTEKVIVMSSIYDDFLRVCKKTLEGSGIVKSPLGSSTVDAAIKVERLVSDAKSKGASLLFGEGKRDKNRTEVTVLYNVTSDMDIYHEETFGPVFVIMKADSEAHAVTLANDTEYGLSSAVFSKDIEHARNFAKAMDVVAVHINGMTICDPAGVPHGGWKSSGYGRFNGIEGLRSFTQTKTVTARGQGNAMPL